MNSPFIPPPASRKVFLDISSWCVSLPLPEEVTLLCGDKGAWSEVKDAARFERIAARSSCVVSQSETLDVGTFMGGVTELLRRTRMCGFNWLPPPGGKKVKWITRHNTKKISTLSIQWLLTIEGLPWWPCGLRHCHWLLAVSHHCLGSNPGWGMWESCQWPGMKCWFVPCTLDSSLWFWWIR